MPGTVLDAEGTHGKDKTPCYCGAYILVGEIINKYVIY